MATLTTGDRVRRLRAQRGIPQKDLAAVLGLSNSYVSLIESGKREPTPHVLDSIAKHLGCTPDYLRTGRGGEETHDADLHLQFAELALRSGDAATAREGFAKVLAQAERAGHDHVAHDARWGLCRAEEVLGEHEAVIHHLRYLLGMTDLPASLDRSVLTNGLCRAYLALDDTRRAVEIAEAALAALRAEGEAALAEDAAIELTSTLVGCYYEQGDLVAARLLVRELLERVDHGGSPCARAAAYWNAGVVAEARGNLRDAHAYTQRALALYSEGDNPRHVATVRLNCAWLLLRLPEPDHHAAAALLGRALDELRVVGTPLEIAAAETELARCRLVAGDAQGAMAAAASARARLGDDQPLESCRAAIVTALALIALQRPEQARRACSAASADLGRAAANRHTAALWRELAQTLVLLGRQDEALRAYERATDAAGVPKSAAPFGVRAATAVPPARRP